MTNITFKELDLLPKIQIAMDELGFVDPTEIQSKAIPLIRTGIDVIGRSQTGTGKTLAFSLPLTEIIDPSINRKSSPQALVLCPTRELAQQVADVIRKLVKHTGHMQVAEVYGGASLDKQFAQLRKANIVVGTPGRVMDHMRRGTLKLEEIKMVVLDEADEMLSMGFKEDMETILKDTPEGRQTILFSATMPPGILAITKEFQKNPEILKTKAKTMTVSNIEQSYVEVPSNQKFDALDILLHYYEPSLAIIFCNTKKMAEELTAHLNTVGIEADGLHGDLRQSQRTNVMNRFKFGKTSILVATDVAARGIDVNDVEYVFNFDLPQNAEYYTHRIGRTGRVGKAGTAITLCTSRRQINALMDIASQTKSNIKTMALPSFSDITQKSSIGSLSSMRRALSDTALPKYDEMLAQLQEEGYTPDQIAISAMSLAFAESDAMRANLKPITIEKRRFSDSGRKSSGRKGQGSSRGRDNHKSKDGFRDKNRSRDKDGFRRKNKDRDNESSAGKDKKHNKEASKNKGSFHEQKLREKRNKKGGDKPSEHRPPARSNTGKKSKNKKHHDNGDD